MEREMLLHHLSSLSCIKYVILVATMSDTYQGTVEEQ